MLATSVSGIGYKWSHSFCLCVFYFQLEIESDCARVKSFYFIVCNFSG